MKNQNKRVIPKICVLIGLCLLVIGVFVLISWQWNIYASMKKSEAYVHTILNSIPETQGAVLENRRDNRMSIFSVNETDFIGILEMPQYKSVLPVCNEWGKLTKYPCRFNGSVYDRTMQIGLTSQKGQYDFFRDISIEDTVLFTDMEGNSYTYLVKHLRYEKHADLNTLNREKSDLTIFIKNVYDFEYLIVSCKIAN